MLAEVVPVLIVVIFWSLLFILALWFSRRALRAPREAEMEEEQTHAQTEEPDHEAISQEEGAENTSAPVDRSSTVNSAP